MRKALLSPVLVSFILFAMMGCEGLPCPNNDDQQCYTDLTGLVCNQAVRCPTGACGTCQFPGEQDAPCEEDADCVEGLNCDQGVCNIRVGSMAQITAGCFNMGDAFNEGDPDELPVHNVRFSAFEIDVHEVANAEYAACVNDRGCTVPSSTSSVTRASYYGNPSYDDFPVIRVSWYQAAD